MTDTEIVSVIGEIIKEKCRPENCTFGRCPLRRNGACMCVTGNREKLTAVAEAYVRMKGKGNG